MSKVSGLSRPRCSRRSATKRPNRIRRVFSGWNDSENSSSRSRTAAQMRRASCLCSKPTTKSFCVPHDDHVAPGLAMLPSVGPEIEHVVQVHVRKKQRDHRSLPRARVTDRMHSVFQGGLRDGAGIVASSSYGDAPNANWRCLSVMVTASCGSSLPKSPKAENCGYMPFWWRRSTARFCLLASFITTAPIARTVR